MMDIQKEMEQYEAILKESGYSHRHLTKTAHGYANPITQFGFEIWFTTQKAAKTKAVPECKWTQNEDGYFDASCGQSFVFSEPEDKPSKHKFTHCCFCGGKLVEAQEQKG